jgi:hypothetical protein
MPCAHAHARGALVQLAAVFQMISDEYAERNEMLLPADTTEILHA